MRLLIFALCLIFAASGLTAQPAAWQPSPGHTQLPIWPGAVPDAQPVAGLERSTTTGKDDFVAGKPYLYVERVSRPTMTVYSPKTNNNTGAAVVVFPGGGYEGLAIDLEGTEVCDWLTAKGITCVLLKYRVPGNGLQPHSGPYPKSPMALEDAQRTLGLFRFHAAEWHIDPHRIGVLGFSSGGNLAAAISTHFGQRLYAAVDAADKESCRPDFAVALYPGHMRSAAKTLELSSDLPVTRRTPPTFLMQAGNDDVDSVYNSLAYYIALQKAGVPAEMHLYAEGKHAFGLRPTKFPITRWRDKLEIWLRTLAIIPK